MSIILGVDAGNHFAKVAGCYGTDQYRTAICEWFERDFEETFGLDDMEFEIDNKKGYAGTIATYEDVFGGSAMYGDSKAHHDTKIRVLLAIHRYLTKYNILSQDVSIVVGQPIVSHKQQEKIKLQEMLTGLHQFKVNDKDITITIHNVGVAGEGSGAYWANPLEGKMRILDIGSGTINASTIKDRKVINTESATFNFGTETVQLDLEVLAKGIIRESTKLRWKNTDTVMLCGGVAQSILPHIRNHYTMAKVITPFLEKNDGAELCNPIFANAVGFYTIAKGVFH